MPISNYGCVLGKELLSDGCNIKVLKYEFATALAHLLKIVSAFVQNKGIAPKVSLSRWLFQLSSEALA